MIDLCRVGFAFTNEWYWRIAERTTTLTAHDVVVDLLRPMARIGAFAIEDIAVADRTIACRLAERSIAFELVRGDDRTVVERLVVDVNRELAHLDRALVIAIPRRYELRAAIVALSALAELELEHVVAPRRWPRASVP